MQFTIGISFYNAGSTLADAIRSVFAQTIQDWELILVDDGSHDASLEVANAVRDPRVTVFSDGENRGLEYRLNQIIELAEGEYIARMDADDLMHPDRLRCQLECLLNKPDTDIVSTGMCSIDVANRPLGKRNCEPLAITGRDLLAGACLAHATVVGRKPWFRANPYSLGFDRAEDYELWCRTCVNNVLAAENLPEPLYFVREEGSVTLAKMLASYRTQRKILRIYGPTLCNWPLTWLQIAKIHAKGLAYCLFSLAGKQMALVNRRNQPLSADEARSAEAALKSILETPVPGLPTPDSRRMNDTAN